MAVNEQVGIIEIASSSVAFWPLATDEQLNSSIFHLIQKYPLSA
ncbi:hypothetical protein [Methylomonas albis]|nr:hypothetical protein [Methylomonas albis]